MKVNLLPQGVATYSQPRKHCRKHRFAEAYLRVGSRLTTVYLLKCRICGLVLSPQSPASDSDLRAALSEIRLLRRDVARLIVRVGDSALCGHIESVPKEHAPRR